MEKSTIALKAYQLGGSSCTKYLSPDKQGVYIKEIRKDMAGIENGFKKFYHEIRFMQKNNRNARFKDLYSKVLLVKEDATIFSAELEYCFDGVTLADLLRNQSVEFSHFRSSLEFVLDTLFQSYYSVSKAIPIHPDFIRINYTQRVRRRMASIFSENLIERYGFSTNFKKALTKGVIINGQFYPPVLDYMDFIDGDINMLRRLTPHTPTESHHDLIPANILVHYSQDSGETSAFRLIDPRGEGETGEDTRHFIYDLGKILVGVDTLDIFRIFNGSLERQLFFLSLETTHHELPVYSLSFDTTDPLMHKYMAAYLYFWEYLESRRTWAALQGETELPLKCRFSHAHMYHPDVPCRIIYEKDENIVLGMYLRGLMMLRHYMIHAYGSDPLAKEQIQHLNLFPSYTG